MADISQFLRNVPGTGQDMLVVDSDMMRAASDETKDTIRILLRKAYKGPYKKNFTAFEDQFSFNEVVGGVLNRSPTMPPRVVIVMGRGFDDPETAKIQAFATGTAFTDSGLGFLAFIAKHPRKKDEKFSVKPLVQARFEALQNAAAKRNSPLKGFVFEALNPLEKHDGDIMDRWDRLVRLQSLYSPRRSAIVPIRYRAPDYEYPDESPPNRDYVLGFLSAEPSVTASIPHKNIKQFLHALWSQIYGYPEPGNVKKFSTMMDEIANLEAGKMTEKMARIDGINDRLTNMRHPPSPTVTPEQMAGHSVSHEEKKRGAIANIN